MNAPAPTLRPYQIAGRDFLVARRFAILGDWMGLGKTPQALAAVAHVLALPGNAGARVLILAPAATLPGLAREVARWLPGAATPVILDHRKTAAPASGILLLAWTSAAKRVPELLAGPRFAATVMDESHKVKNPTTATTKAALGAWRKRDGDWVRSGNLASHSDRVWALTGTPVPNRPIEIQPILHLAGNLRWAAKTAFGDRYCRQVNRFTPQGFDYTGARHLDELAAKMRADGVLLRRLPEDVPGELPTLSTSVVPLDGVREPAIGAGLDPETIRAAARSGGTLPFDELAAYRAEMGLAKAPAAAAWITEWLDANAGEALVVFTWHRAVAAALAEMLGAENCFVATGDTSPAARQEMVDAFASGQRRVFIGSIAACGTGLNGLHIRTTHCCFAEVAWTPGELTQAIGRIRRIGSTADHATAAILVGADSLEDHILQTIAEKLDIAAEVLGDTATGSAAATPTAPALVIAAADPATPAEVDTATCRWTWAKLLNGSWGARANAVGTPELWSGAEVSVIRQNGEAKTVVLVERAAVGRDWSTWTIRAPGTTVAP